LYERVLLYMIFIRSFHVVNFNVSSTKDNAHAKLSRYTYILFDICVSSQTQT